MLEVRRVRAGDGPKLGEVRLNALRADPSAFGSSYDLEAGRSPEDWEGRAVRAAEGPAQFLVLAGLEGSFIGMAGAYQPEEAPTTRELYGMWVSPNYRGQGIGRSLVNCVVEWAVESAATEIRLWVVDSNTPAIVLYRSCGFQMIDEAQHLPSDPSQLEVRMVRSLVDG